MRWAIGIVLALMMISCGGGEQRTGTAPDEGQLWIAPDIQARRQQFAPMRIEADLTALPAADHEALRHLVAAARVVDEIFLRQVWTENPEFSRRVAGLSGPKAQAARDYYRIMFGPWDRLADFEAYLGKEPHPPGAGFYPEDLTREELERWIAGHPEDGPAFTSTTTVIRRKAGGLVAIPYSEAYAELLGQAADELRGAAAATQNETLRSFLTLRADALASNDYYASDMAWMDLDSPIEVVIGPYETYEDQLLGYKASFESFVCVAQPEESARLARYKQELPFLERNLPIPDEHKNLKRGGESPIRVVDEVFTAGDAKAGVQTLAFNLPNDERVREAKGSKKVLLKNMMHAKYEAILVPIAERALPEADVGRLQFEPYFMFILFHELSHGLGPGRIVKDGKETEVRLELRDLYSAIEEAKADVLGVYNLQALAARGVVPSEVVKDLPWSYTAGLFRAARFGTTEAHGLGVVIQASYLLARGGLEVTPEGRFRPVPGKFAPAIRELAHDLLMVEATGSYRGAQDLVKRYGQVSPAMAAVLSGLEGIPVDVEPVFGLERLGS